MYNLSGFAPGLSYFGAANSYNGFTSNFPILFNPKLFDHIYIIKGGPGTGKSSLIRAVGAYFGRQSIRTEAIYCSSDPTSLDGIIIEFSGKRVAILDGTAPHTTDPRYPIAMEEIINLGNGLNKALLKRGRRDIEALFDAQSREYRDAYYSLKIAGDLFNRIYSINKDIIGYLLAESLNSIGNYKQNSEKETRHTQRIEGSFSRLGYTLIDRNDSINKSVFVGGDELMGKIALGLISTSPRLQADIKCICPSPLCGNMVDRIYLSDRVIEWKSEAPQINIELDANFSGDYSLLRASYYNVMSIASAHLAEASRYHFELEDIYKRAMSFELCESELERITLEIDSLLDR